MAEPELRPRSVTEIVDETFRLYRSNFLHFVAVSAVIQVPLGILWSVYTGLMQHGTLTGSPGFTPVGIGVGFFVLWLFSVIGYQLCTGALLKSVSESYLGGEISVGTAYDFVLPRLFRLVVNALLVLLIVVAGFLLLIVPGIIFTLWFCIVAHAIVLEDEGVLGALGRSKRLVSGNLRRAAGLLLLVGILGWVISAIFQMAGGQIARLLAADLVIVRLTISQAVRLVGGVLVVPIQAAALVLFYYDLRMRKEGFDLELLAERMGAGAQPADLPSE